MLKFRWNELNVTSEEDRQCCFCGNPVLMSEAVQLHLSMPGKDRDAAQYLWSHGRCLKEKLGPNVPTLFDALD